MSQRLAARHLIGKIIEHLILVVESIVHLVLGIERLDNPEAAQCLLYGGHKDTPLRLSLERSALQTLAHTPHDNAGKRQEDKYKESELPRYGDHHAETDDNHNRILEHHVERCHDRILDFRHVAAHSCHHIAFALHSEKAYRQPRYLVIDIVADIANYTRAHRNYEVGTQISRPGLQSGHYHQLPASRPGRSQLSVPGYNNRSY